MGPDGGTRMGRRLANDGVLTPKVRLAVALANECLHDLDRRQIATWYASRLLMGGNVSEFIGKPRQSLSLRSEATRDRSFIHGTCLCSRTVWGGSCESSLTHQTTSRPGHETWPTACRCAWHRMRQD